MGGFCVFPAKRNKVGIWFLRPPAGSEPSRCIGDYGGEGRQVVPLARLQPAGTTARGLGFCSGTNFLPHGAQGGPG
ncbi:unnamed protein product [Gulo gulo]|uniref:Uncharacterized protein n=1 Tax=Gulo gulo TaxID=48420 RepID=A0A9X9LNC7_GULGU|nr:unnamed protein product [Gulo gulo]